MVAMPRTAAMIRAPRPSPGRLALACERGGGWCRRAAAHRGPVCQSRLVARGRGIAGRIAREKAQHSRIAVNEYDRTTHLRGVLPSTDCFANFFPHRSVEDTLQTLALLCAIRFPRGRLSNYCVGALTG